MLWFPGTIQFAITLAKRRSTVFMVVMAGDDEQPTQMAASWENDKVTETSSNSSVAVKITPKRCTH